jgi:hypothetical protein
MNREEAIRFEELEEQSSKRRVGFFEIEENSLMAIGRLDEVSRPYLKGLKGRKEGRPERKLT